MSLKKRKETKRKEPRKIGWFDNETGSGDFRTHDLYLEAFSLMNEYLRRSCNGDHN